MTLIDCPECSERVSSHAWACPHCGFPVVEYEQHALEEVIGADAAKTGRQRSALAHLAQWARAYTEQKGVTPIPFAEPEDRRETRRLRMIAGALAVVVVALVMMLLYAR